MHVRPAAAAVLNQDVLYAIFERLAAAERSWYEYEDAASSGWTRSPEEAEDATRRATLASCVRVCRAFFDPAASVLWRDLDDLGPVFALQSEDASSQSDALGSAFGLDALLERRRHYLSCIRAVHRPQAPSSKDSIPHIRTTTRARTEDEAASESQSPLQLTKLRWVQQVRGDSDLLPLLSPSLRSLHIIFRHPHSWHVDDTSEDRDIVERVLVHAAEQAPNLTYLRITRTSRIPESWLVPIVRFARVETVDLLEPTYDLVSTSALLQPLLTLRHLQTLKFRLQNASCHAALAGEGAVGGFKTLRELHLNGKFAALQDASELLRIVSSPHLRSLRIDDCERRTEEFVKAMQELCSILQMKFAASLEVVRLSVYGIGPAVTLERPLVEYLQPLLQVRGLKDVRLSIAPRAVVVAVGERDVRAMTDAWPLLERLHLDCAVSKPAGGPGEGGLSLRVLERMVLACPLLTDLNFPVDENSETYMYVSGGHVETDAHPYAYSLTGEPFLCPCLCSA